MSDSAGTTDNSGRFLLCIPTISQREQRLKIVAEEGLRDAFSSRLSDRVQVLKQQWRTLDPDEIGYLNGGRTTVDVVAMCRIGTTDCVVAEVLEPVKGREVVEIEESLTRAGFAIAQFFTRPGRSIPWVGRVALLETWQSPPPMWLGPHSRTLTITSTTGEDVKVTVGWGNGLVEGWQLQTRQEQQELVRGLVDAQSVWSELDAISQSAVAGLADVLERGSRRVSRDDVGTLQRLTTRLQARLSVQNLAFDDILLNTQGARSSTAKTLLDAWGYQSAAQRVERQLSELATLTTQQSDRLRRRYERTVEVILLGLGMLTLVDIVLSSVSTAFSEASGDSPRGSLGLFEMLRNSGGEDAVTLAFVLILAVALILFRGSRQ